MISFDPALDISTLIALAIFLIGGITVWYNTRAQVAQNTLRIQELRDMLAIANAKAALTAERTEEFRARNAQDLAEYKLTVAKEYATNNSIRAIEERVVAAIERLGDRLDKFLDGSARPPPKRET